MYQWLNYFPLLFWFTQNEAEVVVTFFSVGYLVGSLNIGIVALQQMKQHYRKIQAISLILVISGAAILIITATLGKVYLLALGAFLKAVGLSVLATTELQAIPSPLTLSSGPSKSPLKLPTLVLSLSFGGLYASALTAVGD